MSRKWRVDFTDMDCGKPHIGSLALNKGRDVEKLSITPKELMHGSNLGPLISATVMTFTVSSARGTGIRKGRIFSGPGDH